MRIELQPQQFHSIRANAQLDQRVFISELDHPIHMQIHIPRDSFGGIPADRISLAVFRDNALISNTPLSDFQDYRFEDITSSSKITLQWKFDQHLDISLSEKTLSLPIEISTFPISNTPIQNSVSSEQTHAQQPSPSSQRTHQILISPELPVISPLNQQAQNTLKPIMIVFFTLLILFLIFIANQYIHKRHKNDI